MMVDDLSFPGEAQVSSRPLFAWEVEGFRTRPITATKWSRRGVFGSVRIGNERRANIGMESDEVIADHCLRPRPCRMIIRGYRFERPARKDVNWKRFRKTRWKEAVS
jgi:hypothetical protein